MVRIPYIKIPSVRVRCIDPTSNIGTGGATPAPPAPITYLTQWKIVGNSEVHGNEIWSCGEYNATDGKYHILVQPQGGSIADIALNEPLRKVNDVADSIEFPSGTEGKALVTRNFSAVDLGTLSYYASRSSVDGKYRYFGEGLSPKIKPSVKPNIAANMLCTAYTIISPYQGWDNKYEGLGIGVDDFRILIFDNNYTDSTSANALKAHLSGAELIYEVYAPTTELVDAPQIEEADSYTCEISQGGKAVSWSSFETNSE